MEQRQGVAVQRVPDPLELDTVQAQVAIQPQPAAEQGLQVEAAHLNQLLSVTLPPLPQF